MAEDGEPPGEALLYRHGRVVSWDELPEAGRTALERYLVAEGRGRVPSDGVFVFAEVPTAELTAAILERNPDVRAIASDWDGYAAWYARSGRSVEHGDSVWAVIADQRGDEVVLDGWHRLHSYVRRGLPAIPMVGLHRRPEPTHGQARP